MPPLETSEIDLALQGNSQPFIGRWRQLVSTTNWDKGRIITDWRSTLLTGGGSLLDYGDEAWSRLVGGVTPQHVGRLRRVYERFGGLHATFEGLYWSHFHAALDWDDAEMWLEGAVQNDWSVSQMRKQRWETLGGAEPRDNDILLTEWNEDLEGTGGRPGTNSADDGIVGKVATVQDTSEDVAWIESQNPSRGEPDTRGKPRTKEAEETDAGDEESPSRDVDILRPFARLAELPADLQEAFDAFKLSILRHKVSGWREIGRDEVLAALDALKQLVVANA